MCLAAGKKFFLSGFGFQSRSRESFINPKVVTFVMVGNVASQEAFSLDSSPPQIESKGGKFDGVRRVPTTLGVSVDARVANFVKRLAVQKHVPVTRVIQEALADFIVDRTDFLEDEIKDPHERRKFLRWACYSPGVERPKEVGFWFLGKPSLEQQKTARAVSEAGFDVGELSLVKSGLEALFVEHPKLRNEVEDYIRREISFHVFYNEGNDLTRARKRLEIAKSILEVKKKMS